MKNVIIFLPEEENSNNFDKVQMRKAFTLWK